MNKKLFNNLSGENKCWIIGSIVAFFLLISLSNILNMKIDNANEKIRIVASHCLKNTNNDDDLRACEYYGRRHNVDHKGDIIITENKR